MDELRAHPAPARTDAVNRGNVDRDALAAALRSRIAGEVRFADGDRALYATDASNYRQVPLGVCIPKSKEDVVAILDTMS